MDKENIEDVKNLVRAYYDRLKSKIKVNFRGDFFYSVILPEDPHILFLLKKKDGKYIVTCTHSYCHEVPIFDRNKVIFGFVDKIFDVKKVRSLRFKYDACVVEV